MSHRIDPKIDKKKATNIHTVVAAFGDRYHCDDEDNQANDAKTEANRFHGLNRSGMALSSYEFAGCRVALVG